MKVFILLMFITLTPSTVLADELLKDPLKDIKISKNQIAESLLILKNMGKISEEDYQKAMNDLKAMDQKKINSLTDNAINLVRKDPDKALELYQGKKLDPDKVKELQNSKALTD